MQKNIFKNFIIILLLVVIGIQSMYTRHLNRIIHAQPNYASQLQQCKKDMDAKILSLEQELDATQDECIDAIADAIQETQDNILAQF